MKEFGGNAVSAVSGQPSGSAKTLLVNGGGANGGVAILTRLLHWNTEMIKARRGQQSNNNAESD
jgi:hypothetical protein